LYFVFDFNFKVLVFFLLGFSTSNKMRNVAEISLYLYFILFHVLILSNENVFIVVVFVNNVFQYFRCHGLP